MSKKIEYGLQVDLDGAEKTQRQLGDLEDGTKKLTTHVEQSGTAAQKTGKKVDGMGNAIQQSNTKTEQAHGEQRKLRQSLKNTEKAVTGATKQVNEFTGQLDKTQKKAKSSTLKALHNEFFSLKNIMKELGIPKVSKQIAGVTRSTKSWLTQLAKTVSALKHVNNELRITATLTNSLSIVQLKLNAAKAQTVRQIKAEQRAYTSSNQLLAAQKKELDKNVKGSHAATNASKAHEQQVRRTTSSIKAFMAQAALMLGMFISLAGASKALTATDDFNVLQQRIKTATAATGDYLSVSRELYSVTQQNNAAFDSTVALFQRLSQGRKELQASNADMLDFTDTVQKLGVISGATNENMKFGLTQLAQAMSGSVVRAEEFNSLIENIPEVANRIAIGMNKTKGELRQMMLAGELMSRDVFNVLILQADEVAQQFNSIEISMQRGMQSFRTSLSSALSRLDEVSNTTGNIALLLKDAADTLDSMNASQLQNLVAGLAAIVSFGAAVIILKNMGISILAIATASKTAGVAIRTFALGGAAQMNVFGQVVNKTTFKTRALTVATKGLKASLSLLGGPVGLAALAGLAIYEYLSAAEQASEPTQILADKLYNLTAAFDSTNNAAVRADMAANTAQILGLAEQINTATQKQAQLQAQLNNAQYLDAGSRQQVTAALNEQNSLVNGLINKRSALMQANAALANTEDNLNALTWQNVQTFGAYDKRLQQLHSQLTAGDIGWGEYILKAQRIDSLFIKMTGSTFKQQKALDKLMATLYPGQKAFADYQAQSELLKRAMDTGVISFGAYTHAMTQLTKAQVSGKKALSDTEKQLKQNVKQNKNYVTQLQQELALSKFTGKELAVQTALRKLNADATDEQKQQVQDLSEAIYDFQQTQNLESLIESADEFGNAWSRSGSVIIDTFGSIADAMNDYSAKIESIAALEAKLAKEKANYLPSSKQYKELEKAELGLAKKRTAANISSYSTIAGAASQMFSEQSKGREALHRMEQVFAAAEIALALQKAAANALTAITNQGAGDPYTAFARIAAMAALMAGLGVFSGSTSGGNIQSAADVQKAQGTGSVFGDSGAKSESISNAWQRFEDIELDQLAELQGIRTSMHSLNSGISRLAVTLTQGLDFNGGSYGGELGKTYGGFAGSKPLSFISSFGGLLPDPIGDFIFGKFSSTKKELLDSGISFLSQTLGDILDSGAVQAQLYNTIETTKKKFWGLSKKTSTDIEYSDLNVAIEQQMGAIFGHIGDSVIEAAQLLGFETVQVTQSVMGAVFDDAGDIPEHIRDRLSGYWQSITTTTEMSLEDALANFEINLPQISFKDLSGEEIQQELEAVFSQQADLIAKHLVPSITEYQQIGEGAYDTLLRVAQEQVVFNDHLARMGAGLGDLSNTMQIDVAQAIIELSGGLDKFTDASNTFFKEFFSEEEQFAHLQQSLNEALGSVGQTLPATREEFKQLVVGIDKTTEEGQRLFAMLLQLSGAADQFYDALEDSNSALNEATKLQEQRLAFETDISRALAEMDMSQLQIALRNLDEWYQAQITQAEELGAETALLETLYGRRRQDAIQQALENINTENQRQLETLNRDTERELNNLTQQHDSAVSELNSQYQQLFDTMNALSGNIDGSILSIRRSMSGWDEVVYVASLVREHQQSKSAPWNSYTVPQWHAIKLRWMLMTCWPPSSVNATKPTWQIMMH